jgi:hypothetical protein
MIVHIHLIVHHIWIHCCSVSLSTRKQELSMPVLLIDDAPAAAVEKGSLLEEARNRPSKALVVVDSNSIRMRRMLRHEGERA